MSTQDNRVCFIDIYFNHSQVSAMGSKLSVPCHVAMASLASCHGLREYWHCGFCELGSTSCIQSKKEKRGRGSKSYFILKTKTEGKKLQSSSELKNIFAG